MNIRQIKLTDDRLEISNVYEKSWKFTYRGIIPQSYLDRIPNGRWASHLDSDGIKNLIMLEKGKIIGTSSYCISRLKTHIGWGEIISIYLLPEYIGKGYGRPLLQAAIENLCALGCRDIFLWVLEENHRARHFYESAGFTHSGNYIDDNFDGKAVREVQYYLHVK